MAESIQVMLKVIEVLERLGIPYLVGGSMASSVYGEPRSTQDVDLVAGLRAEHVKPLAAIMEGEFYIDEASAEDAVRRHTSFNVIHLAFMFKVDIFVMKNHPFAQEQMRRRRPTVVAKDPDRTVYMASAEDIVLQKLDWYRQGGGISDRQWRDILGVLKVQADRLDRAHLRQWAKVLAVEDLLERALNEAGMAQKDS